MRKQTGYENDWLNVLSGVTNLANTMNRTKATGLQIENAQDRKEQTERERQGESWAYDYDRLNKGLPDQDRLSPENFTRSGDNIGLPEKTRGLSSFMSTRNTIQSADMAHQDNLIKQRTAQLKKEFAQKSSDDWGSILDNIDSLGNDALPARIAIGELFDTDGQTERGRQIKNENRLKNIAMLSSEFKAGLSEYKTLAGNGKKDAATDILVGLVNDKNLLPQKARIDKSGKIHAYITKRGVDQPVAVEFTPDELYEYLTGIDDRQFFIQNFLHAEAADQLHRESLKNHGKYTNGQELVRVVEVPPKRPGEKFRIEAFDQNGRKINNLTTYEQLLEKNFYELPDPDKAGGKNIDTKGEQWRESQVVRAAGTEAINAGLPFEFGPEGELVPTGPMSETQKQDAVAIFGRYGVTPAMAMTKKSRWFRPDDVSYDYKGMSPYTGKPMAMGLQPVKTGGDEQPPESMSQAAIKKAFGGTQEPDKPAAQPVQKQEATPQTGMTDEQFRHQRLVSMVGANMPKPPDVSDEEWNAAIATYKQNQADIANTVSTWADGRGKNLGPSTGYNLNPRQNKGYGLRYR